jgi:hypothetical protein
MGKDETDWMDNAIRMCKRASDSGLVVTMIRLQDSNDEADIVITNAPTPEMLKSLGDVLRAQHNDDSG